MSTHTNILNINKHVIMSLMEIISTWITRHSIKLLSKQTQIKNSKQIFRGRRKTCGRRFSQQNGQKQHTSEKNTAQRYTGDGKTSQNGIRKYTVFCIYQEKSSLINSQHKQHRRVPYFLYDLCHSHFSILNTATSPSHPQSCVINAEGLSRLTGRIINQHVDENMRKESEEEGTLVWQSAGNPGKMKMSANHYMPTLQHNIVLNIRFEWLNQISEINKVELSNKTWKCVLLWKNHQWLFCGVTWTVLKQT